METNEIINYLRYEREMFILDQLSKTEINEACGYKISKKEWREFTNFCDQSEANNLETIIQLFDKWLDSDIYNSKV